MSTVGTDTPEGPPDGAALTLTDFPVGRTIRTRGVTLTEAHLVAWAGLVGDWHSIHLDAEYAKASRLGQRAVYAQLVFALGIGLVAQTDLYEGGVLGWLGADRLRARRPVLLGDTIHAVVTVAESRPSRSDATKGVVTLTYRVDNQRGEAVMDWGYAVSVRATG